MKKLFVTIPAYNEAKTIENVISSIPRKIKGIKTVKLLVWSDGSSDETVKIAKKAGADYVFTSKRNLGLARTFDLATKKAFELGADIVVNTDGDNQYDQKEIPLLLQPILDGRADIVNGDRQVESLDHMPPAKKYGNSFGSWTIRLLTGLTLNDASSGFRAYTKEAVNNLNIFSKHTYTHETLVQAAYSDMAIVEIPVTFKSRKGKSRLITSVFSHIIKSASTIIRTILMYRAFKYLVTFGLAQVSLSAVLGLRYLYFLILNESAGHIQSLILASMLFNLGIMSVMLGLIADLISINRRLNLENRKTSQL